MDKIKEKKLGFYISFKKSEIGLYEEIKSINNYSQLIKSLLKSYLENGDLSFTKNNNTITLTVDEICKLISSVNSNNFEDKMHIKQEKNDFKIQKNSQNDIPKEMLVGL